MLGPEQARAALLLTDQLVSASGDALLAFDSELRYVYWSSGMERITGLPAAAVIGRVAHEVFPFLAETGQLESLQATAAGHSVTSTNCSFAVPETGRAGVYDAHYVPLVIDGVRVGGTAVIRETTETRRIEQRLRETENRFRNMADAAPVLLWMSGTDGMCNFFNQTWIEFTGRTLAEEWGVGWAEGVHFEDFQRCMDTYLAAFNRRARFEMEYRLRRHDGVYRWILDRGTPRYSPDGTFAGYIGSCIDITERKTLEEELRGAVRVRDDFLSIAAHELRTPLTPIQLTVQSLVRLAQRAENLPREVTRKLERLDEHVDRQARLVENLLDVSRVTAGPVALHFDEFDLAAALQAVADEFAEAARAAGCALRLQVQPMLGRWDRERVEQVFRNLVSNAIKYGAGQPIDVSLQPGRGADVRVVVRDRGIGIPAEQQLRIFERFERAVSERHFGGFGLGLWVTRKLVNAMGGVVAVASSRGEGATFTVDLPSQPSAPRDQERTAS